MDKQVLEASGAPAALGAYSQGIAANGFVFTAGQLGLNPTTNTMISDDVGDQARQALDNLEAILAAADSSFGDAVQTTIFLVDLNDFAVVNQIYAERIGAAPPARTTIQVAALPLGARVEIAMIALSGGKEHV
jgi:2-iminobutanoate/2-iminopropanoate deaminase